MVSKSKPRAEADTDTLDQLPVPVVLFDEKKIWFINKAAAAVLQLPATALKNPGKLSLFNFLEKEYHAPVKKAGALTPAKAPLQLVAGFKNHKGKALQAELKLNVTWFGNKKVMQAVFLQILDPLKGEQTDPADLLQKISTNSVDVIFHLSFYPNTHVKFISNSSKKLLGYAPREIYENPMILSTRVHKDDRKYIITSRGDYLAVSNKNTERKAMVRFLSKTGQTKYIEIIVNPVYDIKKQLSGIVGNMRDVTERVETEALLMETKEKFDLITNNGNDMIAFYTFLPDEKYLFVSPNIKKILGFSPKELLADNMFFNRRVIGSKEYFLNTDKQLKKIQKNNLKKSCYYVFRILKNNKEEIWLECNYFPITNAKGKVAFFLNILRDITEQREKEIEIQNQYLNYQNLLDNSPVAYMIHHHGVCLYCNNALLKLLRLKNKSQILGRFVVDFFDEPERKKAIERIDDIYKNRIPNKFFNYHVRDSEENLVEVEIKSLLIKFNNVDCVLALVNNLSEQRQRERERIKTEIIETNNRLLQKEIKERKDVEKSLLEKTAHLSSIFESSTHLLWTVNKKYEVTTFNQNFFNVVKMQHDIEIKPGYKIDEHLKRKREEYINFWYPKYAEAFAGRKMEFEKEEDRK